MNLESLLGRVRNDLDDIAEPYLYSDEVLTGYLNTAVLEAAIRARLLKDDDITNPDLCLIPVVAGQADYTIDPLVYVVRHAFIKGASHKLTRITTRSLDKVEPGWDMRPDTERGDPCYLIMDISQRLVRLFPKPQAAGELCLRIWRKPLDEERMESGEDEPCIAIADHESLKDWALHEAYLVKDSELYDPDRSATHLGLFERKFGQRPSENELARWYDNPPTKHRAHFF